MMENDNSSHKQYTGDIDDFGSDVRYLSIFLYPVWKNIKKYLDYEDVFNLSSTNMHSRMSIYSLCTELRLRNPNYFRGQRVCDSQSPEFIINQFTSITCLKVTPSIIKFDFLKNKNLNNLRQISIYYKYFSIAQKYLPISVAELKIYTFGTSDESHQVVFNNTEAFKQLRKLYIISVHINDKSLTYLPKFLQYLSISIPYNSKIHNYNFNISHLFNLKEVHLSLKNCHIIKLPCNLDKMHLRGYSEMKELNISYLRNLKMLDLGVCNTTNIILPLSLEKFDIIFCHYLTKLDISNLINLKQIRCTLNMNLSEINLPCNLEKVSISKCVGIENLKISNLIKLKTLELNLLVNLKSLTLPSSLMDIVIKECNILIINEKEIKLDLENPCTKLYSHTIKIRERWELIDYKVTSG